MDSLRRILLLLVGLGVVGTAADLVLLEHYADWWQLAPFALLAAALASAVWLALAPGRGAVAAVRGAMLLLMACGVLGLWRHYTANIEFEREIAPESSGITLVWSAVRGAAPPTLAPAALIHLGLLGLASTYGTRFHEGEER
ncbi:MAG: hypothetical protein AB7P99_01000 [Vicinamibacterales bacterium]